jgi:YVTN family beta-propeller protein
MTVAIGPGSTFAGYRIESLIGRGGMGVVFKATDLSLDRPVALKLIAPELAEDERFRHRFLNEPRLAASLDHPNVVPIYEAGEQDGQLYLAMRYVEGSDLGSVLQAEGRLAPEETIWVLAQVAAALDQAHRRGLVHRDVKPANVLLDSDEHAYLSDFGISTQAGGVSADSGHTGTLDYLAPEQIRGEAVDARSDCYALACILYECLAGQPPFRRQTEAETLWAQLREEPRPLGSHPELDPVLRKGLAKEKGERHESCAELIDAAAKALGLATPAALRGRPIGPALVPRRRTFLLAGAIVLTTAIAASIVALTGGGDSAPEPTGNTLVAIDARTNEVVEQVPVGATPSDVAVGGGAAWGFSGDEKTVSRVDLGNGTVRTFSAGPQPIEIAFGGDALWVAQDVANRSSATNDAVTSPSMLTRFDPQSGAEHFTARLPLPTKASFNLPPGNVIASDSGAVWAIGRPGWVYRLDQTTGDVLTRRTLGASRIATGEGEVWIIDDHGDLVRLDHQTGKALERINVSQSPSSTGLWASSMTVGEGAVWMTDYDGAVVRADQHMGAWPRIFVEPGVDSIAAGAGAVWAASSKRGIVLRIDPKTNKVTARIKVGNTPRALAVGGGRVWIAVSGSADAAPAGGLRSDSEVTALTAPPCGRVLTGGRRDADVLIASDLPLRAQLPATGPMASAVAFTLGRHDFRAGRFRLGYQSCDDATGQYGVWDPATCRDNARAYARNPAVVGVVGPFNSGCTAEMLPILNRAPGGPVALVSPTNSDPVLVRRRLSSQQLGEVRLGDLYPTGQRGYARVTPSDDYEIVAGALLAKRLGRGSVFFLEDEVYSSGDPRREWFLRTARRIGLRVAGEAGWYPQAVSYRSLAERVRASGAGAVYMSSGPAANLGQLLPDLRRALGPRVPIIGHADLTPIPALFANAGRAARRIHFTRSGLPIDRLGATGRRFVREFGGTQPDGQVRAWDVYAAAATEVLLDAIAHSDGTRASVTRALATTRLPDSVVGPLEFDRRGEPISNPIGVLRTVRYVDDPLDFSVSGTTTEDVIRPPARLLP